MKKAKPKYKKGDKVCIGCAKVIDKKNQHLPWHSQQLKAKDKWIEELLQEMKKLNGKVAIYEGIFKYIKGKK